MSEHLIIVSLVGYILVREVFFLYATHKFINKVMSHSFHDYQQSIKSAKASPAPKPFSVEDEPEDLGSLQGIGIL